MRKKYQNISKQILILSKKKNVQKASINRHCFYEKSYIDLITPFTDLIAVGRDSSNKHIYLPGVQFDEYVEYNILDFAISSTLQMLIGNFEKQFKSFLSHKYCQKMKDHGDSYAKDFSWIDDYKKNKQVFDLIKIRQQYDYAGALVLSDPQLRKRRRDVLDEILRIQTSNSKNYLVNHYLSNYHYVPFFIVVHSLSLGKLLTLFGMLNNDDKNDFLCIFNNTNKRYPDSHIKKFESDILRIHVMRNIVNHYESIFPFIQNTKSPNFPALISLLEKLKNNFSNCATVSPYSFAFNKTHSARNRYSLEFHLKIEKIINAIK